MPQTIHRVRNTVDNLRQQIALGQAIAERPINSRTTLAAAQVEKAGWSLRNRQLLYVAFADKSGIRDYQKTAELRAVLVSATLDDEIVRFKQEVHAQLACLEPA